MSDIVERLRETREALDGYSLLPIGLRVEAAAEIERLRRLAVTPEQQAVLDAAERWGEQHEGWHPSDFVRNSRGLASASLLTALRASQPPKDAS